MINSIPRKLNKVLKPVYKGYLFKGEFKGVQFADVNIVKMLDDLIACEEKSKFFPTHNTSKYIFRNEGNSADICNHPSRFTDFEPLFRSIIKDNYALKNVFYPIGKTQSHTSRIRIGGTSKLAAIYPDYKLVCKTYGRIDAEQEKDKILKLHTEVKALSNLRIAKGILVPKIVLDNTGIEHETPALWIEYVSSSTTPKIKRKDLIIKIQNGLISSYEHHGVDFITFQEFLEQPEGTTWKLDEQILVGLGWELADAGLIMRAIRFIEDSHMTFPVSYIHGDAAIGNSLVDKNGNVVIIDWELYRRGFIHYDMMKLAEDSGDTKNIENYNNWLRRMLKNTSHLAPLEIQKHLFYIYRFRHIQRYLWQITIVSDKQSAEKRIAFMQQKVLESARSIIELLNEK